VFEPIAWLGEVGEEIETAPCPASAVGGGGAESASLPEGAAKPRPLRRPFASPAVRRVAREEGVDLSAVRGSGPNGRILKEDVAAAAAALKGKPAAVVAASDQPAAATLGGGMRDEVIPFTRLRQRIAERLTLSKRSIPHFHLALQADMTDAQAWRKAHNQAQAKRVTVTDLVLYVTARALREFRRLNGHVEQDRLILRKAVNLGVATAVEDGLLVPVIADADRRSLADLSQRAKGIVADARRGVVDPNVVGTFTVTSLGQFGIPSLQPIINPPECAILAAGAIEPRVAPIPAGIGVRQMMTLNLACDHRAVDGEYAARFLNRLKELLETTWQPERDAGEVSESARTPQ
jgi:pyruvate dehydrogenase E2 component (dihydrolipoamide acetyltransferase)